MKFTEAKLKQSLLNLGDIEIKPRKFYIAFVKGKNIVDVVFQKKQVKLYNNASFEALNDPQKKTRNVSNVGHLGNGDYEFQLSQEYVIPYFINLVKQSLITTKGALND